VALLFGNREFPLHISVLLLLYLSYLIFFQSRLPSFREAVVLAGNKDINRLINLE
jgi:hypothetical protein